MKSRGRILFQIHGGGEGDRTTNVKGEGGGLRLGWRKIGPDDFYFVMKETLREPLRVENETAE